MALCFSRPSVLHGGCLPVLDYSLLSTSMVNTLPVSTSINR